MADEPTGALDSRTADEILALFENLHLDGCTIIVVTHAFEVAARAPRHITLEDGRIVADAAVAPRRAEAAVPMITGAGE